MKRSILSIVLTVVLVMGLVPGSAFAAEVVQTGSCGDNVTYTLYSDGLLTISGSGAMKDYSSSSAAPWEYNRSSIKTIMIEDGVTTLTSNAFAFCDGLTSVTIPNSVTSLGNRAFAYCENLTNVTIGTNIENSYDGYSRPNNSPFYGSPVRSVTFTYSDSGRKTIADALFASSDSVAEVKIPEGIVAVGERAFYNCDALEKVTIPDSVTEFGGNAFAYCDNLSCVTLCLKSDYTWDSDSYPPFESSPVQTVVFNASCTEQPSNFTACTLFKYSRYSSPIIDSWNQIRTVVISPGIQKVGENAFYGCDNLKELYLPKSIRSISAYCLENKWAANVDVYFAGSASTWKMLTSFGNNLSAPLFKVKMHYGEKDYWGSYSSNTFSNTTKKGTTVKFKGGIYNEENQIAQLKIPWQLFNLSKLFGEEATVPKDELAIAALVLSANVYDYTLVEETLTELGFKNITPYNFDKYDDMNRVAYTISKLERDINGQKTNVISVVCRGTATDDDKWSNFLQQAQGFRYAAEDVKSALESYITTNHINTSNPTKLFITGHSRGAAVANILGTIVSDITDRENTYVYTFACPNTTNESNRRDYQNIFNVCVEGDIVPDVPLILPRGHNKFGNITSIRATPDNDVYRTAFQELTGGVSPKVLDDSSIACISDYPEGFKHHAPVTYMACFINSNLVVAERGFYSDYWRTNDYCIKCITIKCPVDILVYDNNDRLLGKIENNIPDEYLEENGVYTIVEGDRKYIYTTSNRELILELVGTDNGTMDFSVEMVESETGQVIEEKVFQNVVLKSGKTMISTVADDIPVPDTQLFLLSNEEVTGEISTNGAEQDVILLSFDTDLGDQIRPLSVPKGGTVDELPDAHMDGYTFEGWYTDEALTEPFDSTAALTSSATLYAKYSEAYDIYGDFIGVNYDGSAVTATVEYDYNNTDAKLFVALYQNGQMLGVNSAEVSKGDSISTVTLPISNLFGIYQLKGFFLNSDGSYTPINSGAKAAFYAN